MFEFLLAVTLAAVPAASTDGGSPLPHEVLMHTASGTPFKAPAGWVVDGGGNVIVLTEPGHELTETLVEVHESDPAMAIDAAWKLGASPFGRKVKQALSPPATDGWDHEMQINYETTTAEARRVLALARCKGAICYITLLDGKISALDRRRAQANAIIDSFRPSSAAEESLEGKVAHPLDAARVKEFDSFLTAAFKKTGIPGGAVAVVQDGKVVYQKAFGVQEVGKPAPVTLSTRFLIGSMTKSLTSLLMAKLVDEGVLGWDSKVTSLLPSFVLGDPDATKKLELWHTVCACTGLPRRDMEFVFRHGGATPESRVAELAEMTPTTGFGETYQYSNHLVAAGGYVAAHAAEPSKELGQAYDDAMMARVLGPLGMTSSTLDFSAGARSEHATPHGLDLDGKYLPISLEGERMVESIRPAGGLWSTVGDMARYLLLELGRGRTPEGRVVITEKNLTRRWRPSVKTGNKSFYGLGLGISDVDGLTVIGHSGGTMGFSSNMVFIPERNVGMVILTNASGGPLGWPVPRRLIELWFDGAPQAEKLLDFSMSQQKEWLQREAKKIDRSPDEAWGDALLGTYSDPKLGRIQIRRTGAGGVVLDNGEWRGALGREKEDDGTLKVVLLDPPNTGMELIPEGGKQVSSLRVETAQQRYIFKRVKE